LKIAADIPRDPAFQTAEDQGKTVVELDPDSELSGRFLALARELLAASKDDSNTNLSIDPSDVAECGDCV
jgi:nitrogenase iron protein NifH